VLAFSDCPGILAVKPVSAHYSTANTETVFAKYEGMKSIIRSSEEKKRKKIICFYFISVMLEIV